MLQRSIERAKQVPGWMGEGELGWLYRQAKAVPPGSLLVEIGCWLGRSTVALALGHLFPADLFVVDHFRGTPDEEAFFAVEGEPIAIFVANMRKYVGFVPQIVVADSIEASERFADASVSMAFIDAGHSEKAVARDIEAWLPKMKHGGLICGHDWLRSSVERAVRATLGVVEAELSIWFKRLA